MSTLEEIPIAKKVWVMDPSLFDVNMIYYSLVMVYNNYK
jgi:hypothetical protein